MTVTASANAALGEGNLAFMGNSPGWLATWETPLNVVATSAPNFTLTASSTSLAIPQGGSASTTITVNPRSGFADVVSLTLLQFPGVSGSFSENPTGASSVLTINVADSVPAGGYWLQVSGTSGTLSAMAAIFLQITPTYPFDMDVTPSAISLTAGGSGSGSVMITPHSGFSGDVDLAFIGALPDGISANFSPASTRANSSLLISASSTVAPGNYQFSVTGSGGNETTSRTVTVTVAAPPPPADPPDFTLSASASSLTVKGGSTGALTLNVVPKNGFADSPALSCSGLPTGATCTFGPPALQADGSTNIKLTIDTKSLSADSRSSGSNVSTVALALLPLVLLMSARRRKAWLSLVSGVAVFLVVAGALTGCGGASSANLSPQPTPTPPQSQTDTVTVSAVSQSGITHTVKVTLTVN
jgi:hypothetical protein